MRNFTILTIFELREFSAEKNPLFFFFKAHLVAKSIYHISMKGPHCLCVLTDKMHRKFYEPTPILFLNLELNCHDQVTQNSKGAALHTTEKTNTLHTKPIKFTVPYKIWKTHRLANHGDFFFVG